MLPVPKFQARANSVFTKGKPLMFKRIAIPHSDTLVETVTITVPPNERWVLVGAFLYNQSSQEVAAYIAILDSDDNLIWYLANNGALGNNGVLQSFTGTSYNGMNPFVVYEGQKIRINIAETAGKTGNSYYYLNVLQYSGEFDV